MHTPAFSGSRWWKFDFHTHTPASVDYGKGPNQAALLMRPAREWLLDYMRQAVDCVAITDHNSAAGIQPLRDALVQLRAEANPDFREIFLFPGVELSIGRSHFLAIFDPSVPVSTIDGLIGAAKYRGTRGNSDHSCEESVTNIFKEVLTLGGIFIPAHADKVTGAFIEMKGNDLRPLLDCEGICAAEIIDDAYAFPPLYTQHKLRWSRVLGSDSHHPLTLPMAPGQRMPGSHFTWVKMGQPSIDGLRLALLDGDDLSLKRSTALAVGYDPNIPPENWIESIVVSNARYCGRPAPLEITFNPWLNALIGGRGSGKSSILEFSRFALARDQGLPRKIQEVVDLFGCIPYGRDDDGAMQADTTIVLGYRKGEARYRLTWKPKLAPVIEEASISGGWTATEGDVVQRFPVRIFSQRQIAALAEQASSLLALVDEATEVGAEAICQMLRQKETEFMSFRAQMRVLATQINEGSKLRGTLEDIDKKLAVFKGAKHAEVLQQFQLREAQRLQFEAIEKESTAARRELASAAFEVHPVVPDVSAFHADQDAQALELLREGKKALTNLSEKLTELADAEEVRVTAWLEKVKTSAWQVQYDQAKAAYDSLKAQLEAVGTKDVTEFARLNTQRQTVNTQLENIDKLKKKLEELREKSKAHHAELMAARRQLTAARQGFLSTVLGGNKFVQMSVKPYGWSQDLPAIEHSLRQVLGCIDENRGAPRFADDILSYDVHGQPVGGFIHTIYTGLPQDGTEGAVIEKRWADLKKRIFAVRYQGAEDFGGWFRQYLQKLKDEDIDRLFIWTPGDSLDVKYSPRGLGTDFRPLRQASLGQKAAAILAFVLSYGTAPLILDQPEDDLDNELIYDLIVKQMRAGKSRRQIIVVTHNPNIVVNGDAELVVAMHDTGGGCTISHLGTLQDASLREAICTIMEGGHEAFDLRYQRIGPHRLPA